jgi:ankyrin repeat protein
MLAAQQGFQDAVKALLDAREDIEARDGVGVT